ncbi:MAG: hypothetical protein E7273_13110 [Pseudobutyrivibrio ruminis]|nr:hypothetical protein [Pseudobutyrivibrio ruminis]
MNLREIYLKQVKEVKLAVEEIVKYGASKDVLNHVAKYMSVEGCIPFDKTNDYDPTCRWIRVGLGEAYAYIPVNQDVEDYDLEVERDLNLVWWDNSEMGFSSYYTKEYGAPVNENNTVNLLMKIQNSELEENGYAESYLKWAGRENEYTSGYELYSPVEKRFFANTTTFVVTCMMECMQSLMTTLSVLKAKGYIDDDKIDENDFFELSQIFTEWCYDYEFKYYDTEEALSNFCESSYKFFEEKLLKEFGLYHYVVETESKDSNACHFKTYTEAKSFCMKNYDIKETEFDVEMNCKQRIFYKEGHPYIHLKKELGAMPKPFNNDKDAAPKKVREVNISGMTKHTVKIEAEDCNEIFYVQIWLNDTDSCEELNEYVYEWIDSNLKHVQTYELLEGSEDIEEPGSTFTFEADKNGHPFIVIRSKADFDSKADKDSDDADFKFTYLYPVKELEVYYEAAAEETEIESESNIKDYDRAEAIAINMPESYKDFELTTDDGKDLPQHIILLNEGHTIEIVYEASTGGLHGKYVWKVYGPKQCIKDSRPMAMRVDDEFGYDAKVCGVDWAIDIATGGIVTSVEEVLKTALFNAGREAIEDFLDYELSSDAYDKDVVDGMLDECIEQMPNEVFDNYFKKYVKP